MFAEEGILTVAPNLQMPGKWATHRQTQGKKTEESRNAFSYIFSDKTAFVPMHIECLSLYYTYMYTVQ